MILTPVLVILVFLAVQAALYFHAANVAAAAAAQGAAAGSRLGGGTGDAVQAVAETLADLGTHVAANPTVSISADTVDVQVEVPVAHLVPFFPTSVSRAAREPRERFVPEPDR